MNGFPVLRVNGAIRNQSRASIPLRCQWRRRHIIAQIVPLAEKAAPEKEDGEPNKPLAFALTKLDAEHPYFAERGLTAETIATFGVGFCNKGLLRGYAAIPIHNTDGELVAYAGRWPGTPKEGKGKYKLPEGFKKSIELFNLHRAMSEPDETPLVIVEGFFDCMRLWQLGLRRVVALMGCSISDAQEEILTRATTHSIPA